ncbi:unnamed protein product [Clonostachys rhizophaga]|uniref:succinate-semialdehyde dehydrogenase [NAD(P)(+)] n=1 Tax=Clonostachys rhizophaga TaxID=160324 RepID=A0A9N9VDK6_9HYPO|nr:unnamed protein product [Clonostachys rhizophaga]
MELKDKTLLIDKNYIEGKWQSSVTGEVFEIFDPASGLGIGTCPESSTKDVEAAIAAAEAAFQFWGSTMPRERARVLRRWAELILENEDDVALIITRENGKIFADARKEVLMAAQYLEWFSEEAPRIYGDTISPSSSSLAEITVRKEPIGVCGLITPWNFPAAMVTRKIGPALAAGCTVVLKSAGETPLTANALVALGVRAGIPKGVVNVVSAMSNTVEVGSVICRSNIVRKISFTGSTRVGKLLMEQSSPTLKKLSLELGGNAPFIVFEDADLDIAVSSLLNNKFRCSGQTCVCANRIYVQGSIFERFQGKLKKAIAGLKLGPASSPQSTMGPLITSAAVNRVSALVNDAVQSGAEIIIGGECCADLGPCYYKPTILTNMNPTMRIAQEEIFGPVACLFPFDSEQDLIKKANDCDVGLAAYLFTQTLDRISRLSRNLQFGMIAINTGIVADPAAPFGGVKHSGLGREGSKYGIDDYVQLKSIVTGSGS